MWKGELSSCLASENIFGIPYPYWWDRKALLLVFQTSEFCSESKFTEDHSRWRLGLGQGWGAPWGGRGQEYGQEILLMAWEFLCQNKITCIFFSLIGDSGEKMTKTHQRIHCFVCRPDQGTITQRYGWEMPFYCLWGGRVPSRALGYNVQETILDNWQLTWWEATGQRATWREENEKENRRL